MFMAIQHTGKNQHNKTFFSSEHTQSYQNETELLKQINKEMSVRLITEILYKSTFGMMVRVFVNGPGDLGSIPG